MESPIKPTQIYIQYKYKGKSELRNNNNLVLGGAIGLKNIDLINKKANLGYWIGEQYWGRGIATECVGLTIDYAFSPELGLKEISAYVFPENKASIRVLEKNSKLTNSSPRFSICVKDRISHNTFCINARYC